MAAANPAALLPLLFLLLISSPDLAFSQISPSPSPSSSSPAAPSPLSISIPSSSPLSPSPISPSPFDTLSPPSPMAGEDGPIPSPSPTPTPPHEVQKSADLGADSNNDGKTQDEGEMSGGKKAGIAIGVIAAMVVVGLGTMVYKKRQENIRRSRYGYNTRMMEMI